MSAGDEDGVGEVRARLSSGETESVEMRGREGRTLDAGNVGRPAEVVGGVVARALAGVVHEVLEDLAERTTLLAVDEGESRGQVEGPART